MVALGTKGNTMQDLIKPTIQAAEPAFEDEYVNDQPTELELLQDREEEQFFRMQRCTKLLKTVYVWN